MGAGREVAGRLSPQRGQIVPSAAGDDGRVPGGGRQADAEHSSSGTRSSDKRGEPADSVFWSKVFPALSVMVAILIPVIAWQGVLALDGAAQGTRRSAGTLQESRVATTPTALLVATDQRGQAVSFTMLARSGREGGGAVLTMPAEVVVNLPTVALPWMEDTDGTETAAIRLGEAFDGGGQEGARLASEELLGISLDRVILMSSEDFEDGLAEVAPLVLENPVTTRLESGRLEVGEVQLSAAEAVAYAFHLGPEETEENRLLRHQLVWRAWLEGISAAGEAQAVATDEPVLGEEVAHLAAGPTEFPLFPFERVVFPMADGSEAVLDVPRTDALQAEVLRVVPFPAVLGGELPSVRVLSGTGEIDDAEAAAALLANTGTTLRLIGLTPAGEDGVASRVSETEIVYQTEDDHDVAVIVREALGAGTVVLERGGVSAVNVTVVVGSDMADALE